MKVEGFGPIAGDETQRYHVSGWKAKTVGELIDEIVNEHPNEWGRIYVRTCGHWTEFVEYRNGKLVSRHLQPKHKDLPIRDVQAIGGWGNMDYHIYPKYDTDGMKDGDVVVLTDGNTALIAVRDEDRAVVYSFDKGELTEHQCIGFPMVRFYDCVKIERMAKEDEAREFFERLKAEGYTYMPQFRKVIRAKVLR